MILSDFIILATEQPRSRAYIQNLIKHNMLPNFVVYLNKGKEIKSDYNCNKREKAYFDINKSLYKSLIENDIDFVSIETEDINRKIVIDELKKRNEKYVIFSANGILKEDILINSGKKFIHVHPGLVPQYRGSTCFYYSIINEGKIGATAFFINDKIDKGEVIKKREYDVPKNVNIDNIYDPYVRAQLLYDVLKDYSYSNDIASVSQDVNEGESYHVIHPILKHIAIMKVNNKKNKKNGQVYWFIGLSGSGKSTLANMLLDNLKNKNKNVKIIDGDELRNALGGILGYSIEERRKSANIVLFIAKTLSDCGIDVIVANQGAFQDIRDKARREIVNYNEIYVKCPLEVCIDRDVKGYYKKAIEGEIKDFLGIDQKFDEPINSDLIIETSKENVEVCYEKLLKYIELERVGYKDEY